MLFYILPGTSGEDAMLALLKSGGRERRFGELLGYESGQIDYWLTHRLSLADA